MYYSLRRANLILRISLAVVFFWFGADKFVSPQYWIDAWVPDSVINLIQTLHLSGVSLIYAMGLFEVLVGISLLSNVFIEIFGPLAALMLVIIMFFSGFNEVLVRDIGLIGGLLTLSIWPKRRFEY